MVVNGPGEIWIDRGLGLERWAGTDGAWPDAVGAGEVRELAVRLASLGGRRLDDAQPVVDARLPDGSRLHAVLPPVADGGTLLSLRSVRQLALTLDDLVHAGAVSEQVAEILAALVAARVSVLISGATGAGKTTVLATLLSLVDPGERIVVIEEAGEVRPNHPHVVRLVEKRANVDGAGAVGLDRLVREALRMRPDRIVLGECRGAEVREVMLAFNTGHAGGFVTIHANSAADVPARLTALAALAGMSEQAAAMHAQAAFQVVLHVERGPSGRRVAQIGVLRRDLDTLRVDEALVMGANGEGLKGRGWPALAALTGLSQAREADVWAA